MLTVHEHYRMAELDEVFGPLHRIQETEYGVVAFIGKVSVLLPKELAWKLQGLVGKRTGILRLSGYHVRCLDEPNCIMKVEG